MKLPTQVRKFIKQHKLLKKGDSVIVGVSGGADSVALLFVLNELRHELGISLHVAHYNYNIRRGSKKDQKYVENLADQLGLPITVKAHNSSKKLLNGSFEENARNLRYNFFEKIAKKEKANTIAVAHTEDDQAETVLMRMIRGSGLQGMRSILPIRKINRIKLIRPLLSIQRKQVEQFLKQKKVSFCIDETNTDTKFLRNKVRHQLIPELEKHFNKSVKTSLSSLSNTLSVDYDYLLSSSEKHYKKLKTKKGKTISIKLKPLLRLHQALKRMVIRSGLEELQGNTNRITLAHIEEVEDLIENRPNESVVNLPKGYKAKKQSSNLKLY